MLHYMLPNGGGKVPHVRSVGQNAGGSHGNQTVSAESRPSDAPNVLTCTKGSPLPPTPVDV